jgi:hypothetical protein
MKKKRGTNGNVAQLQRYQVGNIGKVLRYQAPLLNLVT